MTETIKKKKTATAKKRATSKKKVSTTKKRTVAKKSVTAKKKSSVAAKAKVAAAVTANAPTPQVAEKKVEAAKEEVHPVTGVKTTGHAWDGIQEFNNPLPRWWLWTFIACIIFSIGYAVYYPTVRGTETVSGWSSLKQLDAEITKSEEAKRMYNDRIHMMNPAAIEADADLSEFAIAGGKALFALHCSQCHGSGAQGGIGYPNLLDDEWIWGGSIDNIVYTITNGIRHYENENTRDNMMMAYGKEEVLSPRDIKDVARYIKVIAEGFAENESSDRGAEIFAENCTSCHGENGEGMQDMGAPALNNAIWLYGGHTNDIIETVTNGRGGHMPAWGEKLTEDEIKKLAVFVRSLSGAQ